MQAPTLKNPLFLGFAGTSIIAGTSVSSAGTMDTEANSGSTSNGTFRADGRQSGIGWGGQATLGFGLFFGEQAVLAMNTANGGSLISETITTTQRPFLEWQVPYFTNANCRATHVIVNTGTNEITTSVLSAGTLAGYVANIVTGCNLIKATGKTIILCTIPPKPVTASPNANSVANVIAFNALIRQACIDNGYILFDMYAALASPLGDGSYAGGCATAAVDYVHPTGPMAMFKVQAQCYKDLYMLYDTNRSVLNLRGKHDFFEIGGPNMVTAGTLPLNVSRSGTFGASLDALLALPPVTFTENDFGTRGVQVSTTGGSSRYLVHDQPKFISYMNGEEFILSGVVEVTQNLAVSGSHGFAVRLDWEDTGGGSGRRVSLISGPQTSIPKTRLSVLFSPPVGATQFPDRPLVVKGSWQCGLFGVASGSGDGFITWRSGDNWCVPFLGQ